MVSLTAFQCHPVAFSALGSTSITWYHPRLVSTHGADQNHLLRWFGMDVNWCALDEAGLGIEATKPGLPIVNTFSTCTDTQYFASVEGPSNVLA